MCSVKGSVTSWPIVLAVTSHSMCTHPLLPTGLNWVTVINVCVHVSHGMYIYVYTCTLYILNKGTSLLLLLTKDSADSVCSEAWSHCPCMAGQFHRS